MKGEGTEYHFNKMEKWKAIKYFSFRKENFNSTAYSKLLRTIFLDDDGDFFDHILLITIFFFFRMILESPISAFTGLIKRTSADAIIEKKKDL